jgi:hypothetical protein
LILKGFAVYEEAVVVVEVECAGVPIWGRLRSGWGGLRWVVGLSGWRNWASELGCGDGMRSFATLRMIGGVRGCGVGSGCLWGVGCSWRWGGGGGKSRFLAALGMTTCWYFGGLRRCGFG